MNKKELLKEVVEGVKGTVLGASKGLAAIAVSVYSWETPSKLASVGAGIILGGVLYSLFRRK